MRKKSNRRKITIIIGYKKKTKKFCQGQFSFCGIRTSLVNFSFPMIPKKYKLRASDGVKGMIKKREALF